MKLTISGDNYLKVYSTTKSGGTEGVEYTQEQILKLHQQYLDLKNDKLTIKLNKSRQ